MVYKLTTEHLPKNASTWLAIPFIAFRKICGNCARHGWWNVSAPSARETTHCMNCGVLLIACGEHRAIGEPKVRRKRYHVWAMQSLDIPLGIKFASSSTEIDTRIVVCWLVFHHQVVSILFAYVFSNRETTAHMWTPRGVRSMPNSLDSIVPREPCDAWAMNTILVTFSRAMEMESIAHMLTATLRIKRSAHVRTADRQHHLWWLAAPAAFRW